LNIIKIKNIMNENIERLILEEDKVIVVYGQHRGRWWEPWQEDGNVYVFYSAEACFSKPFKRGLGKGFRAALRLTTVGDTSEVLYDSIDDFLRLFVAQKTQTIHHSRLVEYALKNRNKIR
jgi:hypothetical protein